MRWLIIGARKVRVKGEQLISLRIEKRNLEKNMTLTTNIHIEPIENYKKLVGTFLPEGFNPYNSFIAKP